VVSRHVISIEGVRLRLGRHISPRVERALTKGAYEREELRLLDALLEPDDIVVDIGTGLGLVSAYCARQIGSERVFAFEADPDLEPCIRETYELNQVTPTLDMCAVNAQAGRVTVQRNLHSVASSVVRRRVGTTPTEVPGKALNYVLEKLSPTLLIIEAEAADPNLFDEAELSGVRTIVLELHDLVLGTLGTDQVRSSLTAAGFAQDPGLSSPEHLVFRRLS
jgi:FkbM family methyltransferase